MQFINLKEQYQRIKDDVDRRIGHVLAHGQYVMGPELGELETALAGYVGTRYCAGVSDGTTALWIALMALDIGPGDEVITTPFTFVATAEVITLVGARPVFVDIDPVTYNIDATGIEAAITPRTKAIMPVSLYGQCADMDAINAVAALHGLPVIEDAAQSFGATYRGLKSCGLSTIGCTSFFPSKPLGCYGDGGACFTDDEELSKKMVQIRMHGEDRRYHHARIGMNGRLDTLQAAVLLAKLQIFAAEVEARARIGARYTEKLGTAGIRVPRIAEGNTSVYAQYTIEVDDRDAVVKRVQAAGIPTAIHYPTPLHRQPAYVERVSVPEGGLPHAERASQRVFSLPMHPYLDEAEQDQVIAAVIAAIA
jgi:UDP-2-acetamido-2-deoxy-ribo-hexuluronate aminotransferase